VSHGLALRPRADFRESSFFLLSASPEGITVTLVTGTGGGCGTLVRTAPYALSGPPTTTGSPAEALRVRRALYDRRPVSEQLAPAGVAELAQPTVHRRGAAARRGHLLADRLQEGVEVRAAPRGDALEGRQYLADLLPALQHRQHDGLHPVEEPERHCGLSAGLAAEPGDVAASTHGAVREEQHALTLERFRLEHLLGSGQAGQRVGGPAVERMRDHRKRPGGRDGVAE